MKKFFVFWMLIVISFSLSAKWIEISDLDHKLFDTNTLTEEKTKVTFLLNGYEREKIIHNNIEFEKIIYPDAGTTTKIGKPSLPRFSRLFAIPDEGTISFEITNYEKEIVKNITPFPFQDFNSESNHSAREMIIDQEFYDHGSIYPNKIVNISKPAIMRDLRVINITVDPFQFDPKKNELIIYKNIEFEIKVKGNNGINQKRNDSAFSRFFETTYQSKILNYSTTHTRNQEFHQPNYLFIYPDDAQVETNLQYLIDWKHEKGFKINSVSTSTTGTSSSAIKSYIQNAYDNWEDPPEFICLIGDADGTYAIPTWFESWSGYNGEGDHPYVQLEGTDILADAFIGRLSFNTLTEFQTIIAKIISYEKNPFMTNPDWFEEVLLVGDTSPSGQSCIYTNKYVKETMLDFYEDYSFTELYGSQPSASAMNNALNDGVGYFNYRGWLGMSGWGSSYISNLSNGLMLPFAVIITCGTGDFSNGTATSEEFVRAGSPGNPKGAVAAIGTATTGTHTTFNNSVDAGIFSGIFQENIFHLGGALNSGKLNLYNAYPANPNNKVDIFSYWNNLMGDPGLELWTKMPQELNVTYPAQISLGSNFMEILVRNDNNEFLEDAWVTILQGDDDIFATGFTDQDGSILLPIEALTTGNATLTVTKHDHIPFQTNIDVIQTSNFINVHEINIDDDNSGTSAGNSDGLINPGEEIELQVSLKNFGTTQSNSVSATISTNSSSVTITDSYESYGNIAAGNSTFSSDDFDLTIADDALGGEEVRLEIVITDANRNEYIDYIDLDIAGANLNVVEYQISDGGNGILDPAETSDMILTIENLGSIAAENVYGTISCFDSRITITDNSGFFGIINAGEQASNPTNTFELSADAQILPGTQFVVNVNLYNASGYSSGGSFILEIGEVNVTDPLGPDQFGYYCYDDEDLQYDETPVYSWIEIDPNYGGNGTLIPLNDNGDDGDIETINAPFNIKFYRENYDELTVCSNGWIGLGTTEQASYMNWQIPGPLGASPMIAPFWDDLKIASGGVYQYYDVADHKFIVQWSRVQNDFNDSEETFQIIIFDPQYHPTQSRNAKILFQYKTVNNVNVGTYSGSSVSHGQYATVGIEDHTGMRGLQYTFDNDYPNAAKPLEDEMAILFTTDQAEVSISPILVMNSVQIDDSAFNDNGIIDPGETFDIIFEIENIGLMDSPIAIAELTCDNPDISIQTGNVNLGVIAANSSVDAVFSASASTQAAVGSNVQFEFDLTAGSYYLNENVTQMIGLCVEDWESGDFSQYYWNFDGNADWEISQNDPYEGNFCAQSGDIGDYQTSEISITLNVSSQSELSFFYKVSSEANYDYLEFWLDGSRLDRWSGNIDWTEASFMIDAGEHTFQWIYEKDSMVSNGSDCGWIDKIIFPFVQGPPEVTFNQTGFDVTVINGSSTNETLILGNTGDSDLTFNIAKDFQDRDVFADNISNRASGGPDNFGYEWIDSNEPNGPNYNWRDISGIGTAVNFSHNDYGTALMPIGFNFNYYGTNYSQFRINPNGWIGFGNDSSAWSNTSIPNTSSPRPAIFGFWDDLNPLNDGDVYYYSSSDSLIVWFDDVVHYSGGNYGTYDFQMIIYSNGKILNQYRSMSGNLNSATIGIQNAAGNDGLQVVYNNNYMQNELAILFSAGEDWLDVSPSSGTITTGQNQNISLTISTDELEIGNYVCDLIVNTNDPEAVSTVIPIELTILEQALLPPQNVTIAETNDNIVISWDNVAAANSYKIYSSDDPELDLQNWTLEAEGLGATNWTTSGSDQKKFYYVIASTDEPFSQIRIEKK